LACYIFSEMAKPKFKRLAENIPLIVNLKPFYEFALRFDEILLSHRITQAELGERIQLSPRSMHRKKNDPYKFTMKEIIDIETVLEQRRKELKEFAEG